MFSLRGRRKKGAVIEAAEAQETDDIGFALQLQNSPMYIYRPCEMTVQTLGPYSMTDGETGLGK